MNIYHLKIVDHDDRDHDMNLFYSHPTKDGSDLWNDYNNASVTVIDGMKEWTIQDIIDELEKMGWMPVEIPMVEVEH